MQGDTKHISDWDSRLDLQNKRGWDNYVRRRLHLDTARDLECWGICGEFIYVEEVSSKAAIGNIRLNRNNNDAIDLELGTTIKTIFAEVFITHAALPGEWIDVIYGINFEYRKGGSITIGGGIAVTDVIPGVAANNLGKSEDAVHGSGDTGVMPLAVRDDVGGSLSGNDGDYSPLQVDGNGALRVTGGGGGTEYTEDVATPDPIIGSAVLMERDDLIAALGPIEGDWAALRCSAEGAVWVQDFNSDAILAAIAAMSAKITACDTGGQATSALQLPDGHNVTNDNAGGGAAVNIQDGGNTITVDGTFWQATQPVSAAALPLPAGAATSALQLADGHNVTVDNAGGGAAVNIQDGGNTITVDGAFWQATQPVSAAALPLPAGAATSALQLADGHNVTVDNAGAGAAVNIQDGGNTITVDGTVTAVDNGTAQAAIMITHANPDTNQAGAAHACKRALIRALTTNTGLVWVNFGAAAVDGTSYPLDEGDAISVPITNTNQINCLFKVGTEKVAVIYTN